MNMRRFTRLTNAFSKKLENHIHQIALFNNVVQLRSSSSDVARATSDGGWYQFSCVVDSRDYYPE
jgi:hypothetical protein